MLLFFRLNERQPSGGTMKINYKMAIALIAGVAIGGAAVQALHAQAKPPGYIVIDTDVTDADGFTKDYAPKVGKILKDGGGKFVVRGGKAITIEGTPFKRLVVLTFPTLDQAIATYTSAAFKEVHKIGEKYATFRIAAVEGLPQ
jgi:uncharacterized protein (DUF1330 family)